MAATTHIRVTKDAKERIEELATRWNVSASEVIDRLLQIYEAFTESDAAARKLVSEMDQTGESVPRSSPPLIEPEPPTATTQDELRQVVADLLYVMDAAVDLIGTIIGVYPDLRAECGPYWDRLTQRFADVAMAWGLVQEQPPTEETSEEAERQQSEERNEGETGA